MSPSYPTITCETVRREDTSFKTHIHHHHTWHWVLSTRHISSRFIPYFSSCSLRHTIRTLSLTCIKHHSIGFSTSTSAIVSPDGGLQVCWDAAITPAPAQHKCSVVVEHGVGAAPDHHWPLVVLADPHPFPVLNLRYDRSLGLRIVVSQDPGTGPVHIGRSHKHFLTQKYLQWLTKNYFIPSTRCHCQDSRWCCWSRSRPPAVWTWRGSRDTSHRLHSTLRAGQSRTSVISFTKALNVKVL